MPHSDPEPSPTAPGGRRSCLRTLGALLAAGLLSATPAEATGVPTQQEGDGARRARAGETRPGAETAPVVAPVAPAERGASEAGGRAAAARQSVLPATFEEAPSWAVWWERARDRFLRPTAAAASAVASADAPPVASVPGDAFLDARARLGPLLLEHRDGPVADARVEALLALGELDPLWSDAERPAIRAALEAARDSAALGLGEAARTALAVGAREGDLSGFVAGLGDERAAIEDRRCAIAALTRIASRTDREDVRRLVAHHLLRALEDLDDDAHELRGACYLGLASIPLERVGLRDPGGVPEPPSASRLSLLRFLLDELDDLSRPEPLLEAGLVEALALAVRTLPADARPDAAASVIEPLLDRLTARRRPSRIQRCAAIEALGALLPSRDAELDSEVREALWESLDAADEPTRAAAAFALGRVAGGSDAAPDQVAREVGDRLAKELTRASSVDRPILALALGAAAHERRRTARPLPALWRLTLRGALAGARGPAERSAVALALGLAGDVDSTPAVAELLDDLPPGADLARAAVGLGLLAPPSGGAPLRAAHARLAADPAAGPRLAEALALLGDEGLDQRLWNDVDAGTRDDERRTALLALARVGAPRRLAEVLRVAEASGTPESLRAAALHAAERLALPDPLAWAEPWATLDPAVEALLWPGATYGWSPARRR